MAHTLKTYYVPGTSDSSPHLLFMDSSKLSELGPFSQSRPSVYTPAGRDLFCLEQGAHTISVMRCMQSGRHKVSRVGAQWYSWWNRTGSEEEAAQVRRDRGRDCVAGRGSG